MISIHALLAESDTKFSMICQEPQGISIHALLAESDNGHETTLDRVSISIHALLAESDSISNIINNVVDDFYPRSPCGERPAMADPLMCNL